MRDEIFTIETELTVNLKSKFAHITGGMKFHAWNLSKVDP